jgi:hypothetical protein
VVHESYIAKLTPEQTLAILSNSTGQRADCSTADHQRGSIAEIQIQIARNRNFAYNSLTLHRLS